MEIEVLSFLGALLYHTGWGGNYTATQAIQTNPKITFFLSIFLTSLIIFLKVKNYIKGMCPDVPFDADYVYMFRWKTGIFGMAYLITFYMQLRLIGSICPHIIRMNVSTYDNFSEFLSRSVCESVLQVKVMLIDVDTNTVKYVFFTHLFPDKPSLSWITYSWPSDHVGH